MDWPVRPVADMEVGSVRLDVVLAHHRTPHLHLLGDELAQFLAAGERKRNLLRLGELPGDARLAQAGRELVGEAV